MSFLPTKYMGTRSFAPFILDSTSHLQVRHRSRRLFWLGLCRIRIQTTWLSGPSNDFLRFAFRVAHATIENNVTRLDEDDLSLLLRRNKRAPTFIQETFADLYFRGERRRLLG